MVSLKEEIAKYKAVFEAEKKTLDELSCSFTGQLKYHMKRKRVTVEALGFQSELSETMIKKNRVGTSVPDLDNIMAVFRSEFAREVL